MTTPRPARRPTFEVFGEWIEQDDPTLRVEICYPDRARPSYVEVGLTDVRAADSIRIHYDFKRDGWVVSQASRFEWDADDEVRDPDWQEVAFVEAWARKVSR